MKAGLTLPQGCDREYLGLDPAEAWEKTLEIARIGDRAGFDSLWLYDHFQVDPPPEEAIVFEPMVELAALATATGRAALGHLVLAAAYRNPALTVKALSTIDVISGGRAMIGIGAGWKRDEWVSYGYGFPDAAVRLAILEDSLEIISRMLEPGPATYAGEYAHVIEALHQPKGIQKPRIPLVVGGNGPRVTWRLAARFADELNLDALDPAAVSRALPVIADRCREVDRDPETLAVSVHLWGEAASVSPGKARQGLFRAYADLGVSRLIVQGFVGIRSPHLLEELVDDCGAADLLV